MAKREIRLDEIPDRFDGRRWVMKTRPIVKIGDVGVWSMVRRADFPGAMPFVISRKKWDNLPAKEG